MALYSITQVKSMCRAMPSIVRKMNYLRLPYKSQQNLHCLYFFLLPEELHFAGHIQYISIALHGTILFICMKKVNLHWFVHIIYTQKHSIYRLSVHYEKGICIFCPTILLSIFHEEVSHNKKMILHIDPDRECFNNIVTFRTSRLTCGQ